jgi:aminoglycoside/choline kinase family phosphotransferase
LDQRLESLRKWLAVRIGGDIGDIRPASGDASFRRYFRVTVPHGSYIAMDAPPDKEDIEPFVTVAQRFGSLGLNVPQVLESDSEQGFLLLGDLGERMYLHHLNADSVERLYGDALAALAVLQAGVYTDSSFLPDYDETLLREELELFREWFLGTHLGLHLTSSQDRLVDEAFDLLVDSALAQPRVWVHRDYHSRNLMLTDVNNPGILDFQDAVLGPVTYDLVSLLRDCYIKWPPERVRSWVRGYYELGRGSGLPVGDSESQFQEWFDLMGVQRHLKAIGIFSRLKHRDGKPAYLGDIPRTLAYVFAVADAREDLEPFSAVLDDLGVRARALA